MAGVTDAREVIDRIVSTIREEWSPVCDEVNMTAADRSLLWERQVLNPSLAYDL